jgi:hypothetical protein
VQVTPSIAINRRTAPLRGDHAGSDRFFRSAGSSEKGAFDRLYSPGKDVPAAAARGFGRRKIREVQADSGVETGIGRLETESGTREEAKTAPPGVSLGKNPIYECPGFFVSIRADSLGIDGLDGKMARSLLDRQQGKSGHDLFRIKARNNAGETMFSREGGIRGEADDRADVTGQKESVECQARIAGQGFENHRYRLVKIQDQEIFLAGSFCFKDHSGSGRGGRLEPDTRKDHRPARETTCKFKGPGG